MPMRWLMLVFVLALTAAPASAAENVSVRGWAHSEFGRMVFDWSRPVEYEAKITKGKLRIRFARPIDARLDGLRKTLSGFIGPIEKSPDKRVITALVKGQYRLRDLASKNMIIVDLVGKSVKDRRASTVHPASPQFIKPSTSKPVVSQKVRVRTGKHARYGRMVFDWKKSVGYTVQRAGNRLVLRFDSPAEIALVHAPKWLPSQIKSLQAVNEGRGVKVSLLVSPSARHRHFRDGTHVVVDVIGPASANAAKPVTASATPAKTKPTETKVATARLPKPPATAKAAPEKAKSAPAPGKPAKVAARPAKLSPRDQLNASFRPLISVDAERRGPGLRLRFNWREKVAAAAFRRADHLWLLFDKEARLDLGGMQVGGRGIIRAVEQIDAPGIAWLKLTLPASFAATATRRGDRWEFDLAPRGGKTSPGKIVTRKDRKSSSGARVVVNMRSTGMKMVLVDPDIGDRLVVVPVNDHAFFVSRPYDAIQFALPVTVLGLLVRRKAGNVSVRATPSKVEISAPGGLLLAETRDVAKHSAKHGTKHSAKHGIKHSAKHGTKRHARRRAKGPRHPLSHIREWQGEPGLEIAKARQGYIDRIVTTPKSARKAARLDLARFYVSRNMPAAAIGVLGLARNRNRTIEQGIDFRAVRGAAAYLLGHYGESSSDLGFTTLKDDPSVAPWLGALAAAKGDWKLAHRRFNRSELIIAEYPPWLANRFRLLSAEAALTMNDVKTGREVLDLILVAKGLTESERSQVKYLQAFLMKKRGKILEALKKWEALAAGSDRKVRAKAAFAETETLLERGKISVKEAVERLERLTVAWRGDSFEFDVLRRLGDLHNKNRDHRNALIRYRQAASYFKNVQGTEEMTRRMSETFKRLYSDGDADGLPPVRALALYQEFRELTPAGEAGDEMIRRLADRLAKVDLLSQAADLLEHQIKFRLKGEKKAEAGARLAVLRLQDINPTAALKALEKSETDGMSPELERERLFTRAKALTKLRRGKKALAALSGLTDRDAEFARLDVHWRMNDWTGAANVIARLIGGTEPAKLSEEEHALVLRWAIALALAGKVGELETLRGRYAEVMYNGQQASAFRAVAGRGATEAPDYKTLVRQASELDTFEKFMSSYRAGKKAGPAKAVN